MELGDLRRAPDGMPSGTHTPPVVAESGDPFTTTRVIDLAARTPRGRPVRVAVFVDRLNATHLDWLFSERVVVDVLLQLAANWAADYRSTDGIKVEDGSLGTTLQIEDSTRVDPWIVRQALRADAACREALLEFSRRERATGRD